MNKKSKAERKVAKEFADNHELIRLYEFNDPEKYNFPHWAWAAPGATFENGDQIIMEKTGEELLERMRTVRRMTEVELENWARMTEWWAQITE